MLPAPLSPASTVSCGPRFVRCRTIPVRGQVPGRGDAWSSTASAFRTQGYCCIVMLVASGPIAGDKPWGQPVAIVAPVVPIGLSAPFGHPDRPLPPGSIEAGEGSRQAVGRAASSRSVRLAVPTASLLPSAVGPLRDASLSWPPVRSSALPKQGFGPSIGAAAIRFPAARLSRHLRFAKSIRGDLRGVFSDAAAGIAAVSSRVNFSTLSGAYS